jgi:hypothetical protein
LTEPKVRRQNQKLVLSSEECQLVNDQILEIFPSEPKKADKPKRVSSKPKHEYPGCIDSSSEHHIVEKRLTEALSEIEDVNEFPVLLFEDTISGVTLKHLVDNLFN